MLKEQDATYVEASPNDARWGIGVCFLFISLSFFIIDFTFFPS